MGLFSSKSADYRISDDAAVSLRVRAALFDMVALIFGGVGFTVTIIGLLKTIGLSAAAGAIGLVPYVGPWIARFLLGVNFSTSIGIFVAGISLTIFSSVISAVFWYILMSEFRKRGVSTYWRRFTVLFVKAIPFPGFNALPIPWFFMFANSTINASRKEDQERKDRG